MLNWKEEYELTEFHIKQVVDLSSSKIGTPNCDFVRKVLENRRQLMNMFEKCLRLIEDSKMVLILRYATDSFHLLDLKEDVYFQRDESIRHANKINVLRNTIKTQNTIDHLVILLKMSKFFAEMTPAVRESEGAILTTLKSIDVYNNPRLRNLLLNFIDKYEQINDNNKSEKNNKDDGVVSSTSEEERNNEGEDMATGENGNEKNNKMLNEPV